MNSSIRSNKSLMWDEYDDVGLNFLNEVLKEIYLKQHVQ